MPEFLQIVSALREQMSASLSRSDALRPLSWLFGILMISFLGCLYERADGWVVAVDMGAIGFVLIVYVIVYVFFAVKNTDALRSEKYTLQKMAIEHNLRGDSNVGLIDENSRRNKRKPKNIATIEGQIDG